MRYHFYGNYFRFPMELDSIEEVQQIINNCRRARKVQDYWVSRRIKRVVDESGVEVYPLKK